MTPTAVGFNLNFFGTTDTNLFVTNNGNVTFNAPLGTFTPFGLTTSSIPIIAPFFADWDTRPTAFGQRHHYESPLTNRSPGPILRPEFVRGGAAMTRTYSFCWGSSSLGLSLPQLKELSSLLRSVVVRLIVGSRRIPICRRQGRHRDRNSSAGR